MFKLALAALLFAAVPLVAQTKTPTTPKPPTGIKLVDENGKGVSAPTVDDLRKQIDKLSAQLKELVDKAEVFDARFDYVDKFKQDHQAGVVLEPDAQGYERIDTDSGSFLISVLNVDPYLDGYRVSFHIAPMTPFSYKGFKLHLEWYPKDYKRYKEKQEKDEEFTQSLLPFQWNTIEIKLAQTKPDQLAHIFVRLQVSSLSPGGK